MTKVGIELLGQLKITKLSTDDDNSDKNQNYDNHADFDDDENDHKMWFWPRLVENDIFFKTIEWPNLEISRDDSTSFLLVYSKCVVLLLSAVCIVQNCSQGGKERANSIS